MIDTLLLAGACISFTVPHNYEAHRIRFINIVTEDARPPAAHIGGTPVAPYIDPPISGWRYGPEIKQDDIYYWDTHYIGRHSYINNVNIVENTLRFADCPRDNTMTPNEKIGFTTLVVDTWNDNEILHVVDWHLNYKQQAVLEFTGLRKLDDTIEELLIIK